MLWRKSDLKKNERVLVKKERGVKEFGGIEERKKGFAGISSRNFYDILAFRLL